MGARFVGEEGVVLQSKWNDCGAASLKMVLAARGIRCDVPDVAGRLRLTPQGKSMSELRRAALEFGVPARSWAMQPRELKQVPLPVVAFVKGNHFVVVRRWIEPDVLEIDDPALGRLRWPLRSFARIWSGETLVFDPAWAPR
jgi:ATP-binding cassette subfamily B protein RaxB